MIGTTLSHYRVLEKLGEGGMGVVYRAMDLKLERPVALKVMPAEKAGDADRRRRFLQEARAASALRHPGIVSVYEIDEAEGVHFIAMELIEGRSLSDVIGRKGLPVGEAVRLARQVADALACAHASGIVHRDLKPANVVVTAEGEAKLLDFGLAKLTGSELSAAEGDDLPTLAARTAEGTIVGTVAYMSPEQAEGKAVDVRSDVFSFGAMLHEMLTGRTAFARESATATLAAVLRDEPPAIAGIPHDLEALLRRCLRKAPPKRFQSMADVKVVLEEIEEALTSGAGLVVATPAPPKRMALRLGFAAAALALVVAGAWFARRGATARRELPAPVPVTSYAGTSASPALSPDGRFVAFSWNGEKQDNVDVYVKLVGPGSPLRLTADPAVDGNPAFSPDGTQIAFLRSRGGTKSEVFLVPAMGGPERRIAEGYFSTRIAWARDGSTLFVSRCGMPDTGCGLAALAVGTGEVRGLTKPPAGLWAGDQWPAVSPDGRTLAFRRAATRSNSEIWLLALTNELAADGEPRRLTHEGSTASDPAFTPDGKSVVFSVGAGGSGATPSLWIIPASASGEKAERLEVGEGGESPSISSGGRLAWLRWSRDENVWRLPLQGGAPERLVFSTRRDNDPHFSPDGKRITFASDRSGSEQVWIANADGSDARPLTAMKGTMTGGGRWSPDGTSIVFVSNEAGQMEVYRTTPEGQTPVRLTNDPGHDSGASYSRDGRFVYFGSNRDGGFQVWKVRSDGSGPPARVTRNGGFAALESSDGRALYFAKRIEQAVWSVWRMPADGGAEELVLPRIATWGDFDVTPEGIAFIDAPRAGARLAFRPFDGGPERLLHTMEKRTSFGVAVSPDGTSLLFSRYDQESTEILTVDRFR